MRATTILLEAGEEIINNMPLKPEIKNGGDRACFIPFFDLVQMPHLKFFISSECFYSTLLYDLIYNTGHISRLNKVKAGEKPARFGDPEYSKEELTAELGAVCLCNVMSNFNPDLNFSKIIEQSL